MNKLKILLIKSAVANFNYSIELLKKKFDCELYLLTKYKEDTENINFQIVYYDDSIDHFDLKAVKKKIGENKFDYAIVLYNNSDGRGYSNIEEIADYYSEKIYSINNKQEFAEKYKGLKILFNIKKKFYYLKFQIIRIPVVIVYFIIYYSIFLIDKGKNNGKTKQ